MVWVVISCEARPDLHFLDSSSMNSLMYIEDILLNYIVPYKPFLNADSFMPDNAHPHVALWMLRFLEKV